MARLYQTTKEAGAAPSEAPTPTAGSIGASLAGRAALKVSNQKSPDKSFKSGRGTQLAAQMNTLVGRGRLQAAAARVLQDVQRASAAFSPKSIGVRAVSVP